MTTNFLGLKTQTSSFLAPDTIYARDGETLRKFIWTANALADQEREIEALRRKVHDLTAEVTFGVAAERAKAESAERLAAERLEVLAQIGQVAGMARALVRSEADDRTLARIQQLVARAIGAGGNK